MAGRGRDMTLPAWMTKGAAPAQGAFTAEVEKPAAHVAAAQSYSAGAMTAAAATAATTAVDVQQSSIANPNDDPNNWSTHTAPDGRPYYYNKMLNISTYDQPSCLKNAAHTPPVAAAAAAVAAECRWREYVAPDGRPYYSDGTESRWDMPEELRLWKERNAIGTAQSAHMQQHQQAQQQPVQIAPLQQTPALQKNEPAQAKAEPIRFNLDQRHEPVKVSLQPKAVSYVAPTTTVDPARVTAQPRPQQQQNERKTDATTAPEQKASKRAYASEAEAMQAFKSMLSDFKIPSTIKWKEVESQIAKQDPRWDALRSNGQKRQALAEYQNAKGKEEKQLQRQRARKSRDNFLKMLAENTEIDHRTTWREAVRILGEEPRFIAVEDDREREEIYSDFVFELAKKEKQDREAAISTGLEVFREMIENDANVTHKSLWADYKEGFAGFEDPRLAPLSEPDMRRAFQDYVVELDRQRKAAERADREAKERIERQHRDALRDALLRMVEEGKIHPKSTWAEVQEQLEGLQALQELDTKVASQEFDTVVYDMQRQLRVDTRNTRDAVRQFKLPIIAETNFEGFLASIREWESKLEDEDHDRDEREMSLLRKEYVALKELITKRMQNLRIAFDDIKADVMRDEEQRAKKQAKRERRFQELLEDFYYRSDHIGIGWDEAKRELADEREYHDLERTDRKRLFHTHMEELASKMAVKTKAIKEHLASDEKKQSHEEQNGDRSRVSRSVSSERGRGRKRSSSRSRSRSRSHSRSDSRSSRSRSRSRSGFRYVKSKHARHEDSELEAGEVADDSDIERTEKRSRHDKDKKRKKHKHKQEKKSKKSKRSKRSVSSDRSESRKRSRRSVSRS